MIPDTNTKYRYQRKKSLSCIDISMNLGYQYWYDKNPKIGIKWNPNISIGIGVIEKSWYRYQYDIGMI